MKKACAKVLFAVQAAAVSTAVLAGDSGEWELGPAFKDGWDPRFTVALTAGQMDADGAGDDLATGAQVSLDCPWFSPPTGAIRQQFNYNQYDNDGLRIRSFEINPRYYTDLGSGLRLGVGPGFGYVKADSDRRWGGNGDAGMWSFQVGADLEYRQDKLFYGLGVRYQGTEQDELAWRREGADNWLAHFKIGINL